MQGSLPGTGPLKHNTVQHSLAQGWVVLGPRDLDSPLGFLRAGEHFSLWPTHD